MIQLGENAQTSLELLKKIEGVGKDCTPLDIVRSRISELADNVRKALSDNAAATLTNKVLDELSGQAKTLYNEIRDKVAPSAGIQLRVKDLCELPKKKPEEKTESFILNMVAYYLLDLSYYLLFALDSKNLIGEGG